MLVVLLFFNAVLAVVGVSSYLLVGITFPVLVGVSVLVGMRNTDRQTDPVPQDTECSQQ